MPTMRRCSRSRHREHDVVPLREVKRLPMNKPSGKYNVHNKITRSSGTSH